MVVSFPFPFFFSALSVCRVSLSLGVGCRFFDDLCWSSVSSGSCMGVALVTSFTTVTSGPFSCSRDPDLYIVGNYALVYPSSEEQVTFLRRMRSCTVYPVVLLFRSMVSLVRGSENLGPVPAQAVSPFKQDVSVTYFETVFTPRRSAADPELSLPRVSMRLLAASSFSPFARYITPDSLTAKGQAKASSSEPAVAVLATPVDFTVYARGDPDNPIPGAARSYPKEE